MTVGDVLDQVASDASDTGSPYRVDALRWLNAARSYIAEYSQWKNALRPGVTITTAAATTSGLYTLNIGGTQYDFIAGDQLFDETNKNTVMHESYATTREIDQAKETTGPPHWWADAGDDGTGTRQIYLWPVPDGAFTITFPAYVRLTDVSDETLTSDPFFGPISPWFNCFVQGTRLFHDLNDNTDATQIEFQERRFVKSIRRRLVTNRLSLTAPVRQRVFSAASLGRTIGRLDPAHFNNG